MKLITDEKAFNLVNSLVNCLEEFLAVKNPAAMTQEILTKICKDHDDAIKSLYFNCIRLNGINNDQYFNQLIETENQNVRVDLTNRFKTWSLIIHGDIDETRGDIRTLIKKHHHEGYRYFELTCNNDEAIFRFVNFDETTTKYGDTKPTDAEDVMLSVSSVSEVFTYIKSACLINGLENPGGFDVGYVDDAFMFDLFLASSYMMTSGLQTQHLKNMYQLNNTMNNYGNLDETLSEQTTVYYVPSKCADCNSVDVEYKLQLLYKNKRSGHSISSHCNISVTVKLDNGIPYWIEKCSVQPSIGYTVYLNFN